MWCELPRIANVCEEWHHRRAVEFQLRRLDHMFRIKDVSQLIGTCDRDVNPSLYVWLLWVVCREDDPEVFKEKDVL